MLEVEVATDPRASANALIRATHSFVTEDPRRSRAHALTALALTAALLAIAFAGPDTAPWLALRAICSLIGGLSIVRVFIVYHDFVHGSILRDPWSERLGRALLYPFAILVMAPPRVWRETHRYHHSHTAKIEGSHIGSYEMATLETWSRMSARERVMYRIGRHPATVALGYFTVFMIGMCVKPLFRSPRRNWDSGLALALNWGLSALVISTWGWTAFLLGYFVPLAIATALGSYIFYAQHNTPEIHVQETDTNWNFTRAALESSSYMKMGPVMAWFTGNIGYHHVHHLNARIPFYRLPEAMAAIPELRNPRVTTLALADIVANFQLKLWDEKEMRLVGYPAS